MGRKSGGIPKPRANEKSRYQDKGPREGKIKKLKPGKVLKTRAGHLKDDVTRAHLEHEGKVRKTKEKQHAKLEQLTKQVRQRPIRLDIVQRSARIALPQRTSTHSWCLVRLDDVSIMCQWLSASSTLAPTVGETRGGAIQVHGSDGPRRCGAEAASFRGENEGARAGDCAAMDQPAALGARVWLRPVRVQ
eukprot:1176363-Prorocentrum_minimum.AAC.2